MATKNEGITELDAEDDQNMKYMNFKKFDAVDDYSDHHYSNSKSPGWQPPANWVKKIQEEWRILARDLPDKVFVRVYEERMDLLRAVIIGAEGTPYYEGLFFFDVCFPKDYPNKPPKVHYHSGGLRINPNLYANGKVCLSLLNTWIGTKTQKWLPRDSTMLQVLVSIQGLILNANPYFNEPGFSSFKGSVYGEKLAQEYNQRTFVLSLRTMVYSMRKPPKHFEDMVIGHFRNRANSILTTCRDYYSNGLGLNCGIVVGKDSGCSRKYKSEVKGYMKILVGAFKQLGVEEADLEDFVPLNIKNPMVDQLQQEKKKKNLTHKILLCFGI